MPPVRGQNRRNERFFAYQILEMSKPTAAVTKSAQLFTELQFLFPETSVSPIYFMIMPSLLCSVDLPVCVGRQLWTAHPENEIGQSTGFWEVEVLGNWETVRQYSSSWWKKSWMANFRMTKETFFFIVRRYGHLFQRDVTHLRRTIGPAK